MPRTVSATEFKAKCLALIDEVNASGDPLTITKRGQPVAVLNAPKRARRKTTEGLWKGKVEIVGDIVNLSFAEEFEAYREWQAAEARETQAAQKRRRKAS